MGLISKNNKDFNSTLKRNTGDFLLFIKGGSVIIGNKWLVIKDQQVDIVQVISNYVRDRSRRIFNNFNDILYLLIVLNKEKQIEVIPSISYNKRSYGEIKVFENLSEKLPLVLIKLQQDGSRDLSSYKPITLNDIEIYQGYGNFTLSGPMGETGKQGYTGEIGIDGEIGITGSIGETGIQGCTGILGDVVQGETGLKGPQGVMIPAFLIERE